MKISIVTVNYNGERFIEQTLRSVIAQRAQGVDLEYIVIDGKSTDRSMEIIGKYKGQIDRIICEKDNGAFDAINKGLALATGDVLGWLNADDLYEPGALKRVDEAMESNPGCSLCFGHCPIIDEQGNEIRRGITRFKEFFYPLSSRFTIQCINYISQPAMFFRRTAFEKSGGLRQDFKCAWDYDLIIKLFRQGRAVCVGNPPLAYFRWHPSSLSGTLFRDQFREEWTVSARDAGRFSLQALIHLGVWWGIVFCYTLMSWMREGSKK
jgi:glycosyltransferase involved in cell wall biosynthesis